ncbi:MULTISPECIES: universal stress protein [Legionella]|uniref:Universal stress protein n=1 Tax=Legionella maceachernii TaxID=466 RepID=A0A0W0WDM5_9GAMM|nr:universal stress protein [Legionella maceachernii]KTD30465.1 universal stress protein [Legionella maceachernii]SJZ68350.1 Nucleotide-binding universal stress protein, UspA family [Legionella maceachernii]SUP02121.1 Putative universal stress protein SAV1710 [Legionella maceachernii]
MKHGTIVVAIDESDCSTLALKEAIKLTQDLNAKLHAIHVIDETIFNQVDEYVEFDWLWNAHKEFGKKILEKAETQLSTAKIDFATHLIELKPNEGRLAEKIVSTADSLRADTLIIGTHGRKGFSRWFLGSVAEKVIRIATMPVLLVREQKAKT